MDATDRRTFDQAFSTMARAFRLKLKPTELEELTTTYFKILGSAPLAAVLVAGKTMLEQSRTFPKAADWFQALPSGSRQAGPDCRVIGADELTDYQRAERLRFEDEPCDCLVCQRAGVTHRPRRFVPDVTHDDRPEHAYDPTRNRVVQVGHWAHGAELARWYTARDACFASVPPTSPMARALVGLVPHDRDPGEDG